MKIIDPREKCINCKYFVECDKEETRETGRIGECQNPSSQINYTDLYHADWHCSDYEGVESSCANCVHIGSDGVCSQSGPTEAIYVEDLEDFLCNGYHGVAG